MNKKELTFEEMYEIPITLVVNKYSCEYYKCGSHKMELVTEMNLENAKKLYKSLRKVKGIIN